MSSEPIGLTEAEVLAVALAAWSPLPKHPEDLQHCLDTAREVIAAFNKVRVGDPVGTIRRSPDGSVSVRIGGVMRDDWRTTWIDGETKWTSAPNSWPIIYSSEES